MKTVKKLLVILGILVISSIFIGCTDKEKLIKEINNKQDEIINLLEKKASEKLSESNLKEIEAKISSLKEELKVLEEKYK